MPPRLRPVLLAILSVLVLAAPARADEGMWTLDNLPLPVLQERYGFTPTPEWIAHVRLGSLRLSTGGSGSFASPEGLVVTNHHVAIDQLQKMSAPGRDYVADGFFARTRSDEVRCPDLEVEQLVAMQDVTARVRAAEAGGAAGAERAARRRAEIARLTRGSRRDTTTRAEVVELYQGGEYWLHRYRRFTDVRLVMAPEVQTANFGGDPDNFGFPRYAADVAFLRVYDRGRPFDSRAFYFPWNAGGPAEGDLQLICGNPGSTSRLETAAQLAFERDLEMPLILASRQRRLAALTAYAARGAEQARRATSDILDYQNSIKARRGALETLRDPATMQPIVARDAALRARLLAEPALDSLAHGAWERVAAAESLHATRYRERFLRRACQWELSRLMGFATTLARYADETMKPDGRRLEEFRDANLESVRFGLLSPAPVYADLEEVEIAEELTEALDGLGPGDAWVRAALGSATPAEVAHRLATTTKLGDLAERRRLLAGGPAAIRRSDDPLLAWARAVDPAYREVRAWYEDRVEPVLAAEYGRIASARFAAYGRTVYPDATGTLRLAFGRVAGYELESSRVPWKTTIGGMFARSASFDGRPPFELPKQVAAHRADLDPDTPLDYVNDCDTVGGNSGSPVLDRDARFVGILFDGNVETLAWDYVFTTGRARSVVVHPAAILAMLRNVYAMPALADELEGAAR
jgi:hypothetical protein